MMAEALEDLSRGAAPGSDRQLTYVQNFIGVATSDGHLAFVRGLLDGAETLPGLTVDTELRWALLRRLVIRGAAGEPEIAAELERDATAAGERHAAACRASIPTAEAKAAAWEQIMTGQLPNAVFRAVLGGFVEPDHRDLLEPYVEKFFAVVGEAWATWSHDMAQTFAEIAYPFLLIRQDTIDRTDAYIAEQDPQAALRRLLAEGRDGVARALRAQAKDAAG
jgi:aminopeptidase N